MDHRGARQPGQRWEADAPVLTIMTSKRKTDYTINWLLYNLVGMRGSLERKHDLSLTVNGFAKENLKRLQASASWDY